MSAGIIGKKCGMTRIFGADGVAVPVTVLHVEDNKIVQVKTDESNGYNAVQVKVGTKKPSRVNKPLRGHYAKANIEPGRALHEFRLNKEEVDGLKVGDTVELSLFEEGQKVNVQGVSKGKGFAGAVKRHNFRTQDNSHGNSLAHRAQGSIGQNQSPGKVFKGKKMPGQLGNSNKTVKNLEVVKIDQDKNLLLIKGSVPGFNGSDVIVTKA